MHLTPEMLRHAYGLLRETMPFRRWKLPEACDVDFAILRTPAAYADFTAGDGMVPRIRISEPMHTRITGVLSTLAHEMCHMRLRPHSSHCLGKTRSGQRSHLGHGAPFKRLALLVCRHHPEFDPTTF